MKNNLKGLSVLLLSLPTFSFAATAIDLSHQPISFLANKAFVASETKLKEVSRLVDFNHDMHVRVKQTFRDYPIYGADAIIHIPKIGPSTKSFMSLINAKSEMNGMVYENLEQDLVNAPTHIFDAAHLQQALNHFVAQYQKNKQIRIEDKSAKIIIYIDKNNKAHWSYLINFFTPGSSKSRAASPLYIVDAVTFDIFKQWDDLKRLDAVLVGGDGGNHKTKQKIFDGLPDHQPALNMMRDPKKKTCSTKNENVTVKDFKTNKMIVFTCTAPDAAHNNVYWDNDLDKFDTTWSPMNDVLFGSKVAYDFYQEWYGVPVLTKLGVPLNLSAIVHDPDENSYWHNNKVVFGNSLGSETYNPFTSLDTVVHEISHGFTEQHSGLAGEGQAAGINESFSDIAGIAAEYYRYGKTDYLVGWGDVKAEDKALRYMDQPSKDCYGNGMKGDNCSIDTVDEYKSDTNEHFSAGIFNHAFYVLAHTDGWNVRKAFDVMVKANMNYWVPNATFANAACGVMHAARDYKYNTADVAAAFKTVGIDTKSCLKSAVK